MNRYSWNTSLIEPFTWMSLKGILYDASEASAMRSVLTPQVWEKQAAVDALCGVALPGGTEGLLRVASEACCRVVPLRKALKGYKEMRVVLGEDGQAKLNKKGKVVRKAYQVPPRDLSWALLSECASLAGSETLPRLRVLAETPQCAARDAELATLLGLSVNVESPDQTIALLDRLGLPAKFKRGKRDANDPDAGRTGDEEALLSLFLQTSHPITKALLEARSVRGALSWLDTTLPSKDGRIRCSFSNPGSETGRVLTRTWHDGTGGNLQAVSSAPWNFRRLLRADPGYRMAQIDLKGADGWTVAARCAQQGDTTMLLDLQAGIRIPSLLSLLMAGASLPLHDRVALKAACKAVVKDWRDYAFKKAQHLSNYMGSAALIQRETVRESWSETGTPLDPGKAFCERVQQLYLARYWGLRSWWNDVERQVRRAGTLEGASGQVREFLSRRWSGEGANRRLDHSCHKEAVATEPQMVTTFATNLALWRLWSDPENWVAARESQSPIIQPLLHIHDALLVQFPEHLVEWAGRKIAQWFNNPITIGNITLTVPFEAGHGESWGECKESFSA